MHHEPQWKRITAYLLLLFILLYSTLMVVHALGVWYLLDSPRSLSLCTNAERLGMAVRSAVLPISSRPFILSAPSNWWAGPNSSFEVLGRYAGWAAESCKGVDLLILYKGMARRDALFAWSASTAILCPLGFLALPISRRVAKVRWSHIGRITSYSLPIFALPCLSLALAVVERATPSYTSLIELLTDQPVWLDWLPWLFLLIWWSLATRHYLKMPHAWGVGAAVLVMASLGSLAILFPIVLMIVPWN